MNIVEPVVSVVVVVTLVWYNCNRVALELLPGRNPGLERILWEESRFWRNPVSGGITFQEQSHLWGEFSGRNPVLGGIPLREEDRYGRNPVSGGI